MPRTQNFNIETASRQELIAKAQQLGLSADNRTATARLKTLITRALQEAEVAAATKPARRQRAAGKTEPTEKKQRGKGVGKAVMEYITKHGDTATLEGALAVAQKADPETKFNARHFSWYKVEAKKKAAAAAA